MTERYVEKQLAPAIVSRQHAFMLIGEWDRNVETGDESLSLRFRTKAHTIATDATDTVTGEKEVAPRAMLPDLPVDATELNETIAAGTDPVTGADLNQISKAGALKWIKALYEAELGAASSVTTE